MPIRYRMAATATMLLFVAAAIPASAQSTAGQARDEEAIREIVRRYVNARNLRDPRAVGALFTSDADQLTSSGEWRRGRDGLVRGTMESSRRTGGTRRITVETIRFVAPAVAVADGRYEISGLADGSTRHMWTSFVFTRDTDGWRIAAIRNMLPTTPPAASADR